MWRATQWAIRKEMDEALRMVLQSAMGREVEREADEGVGERAGARVWGKVGIWGADKVVGR